MLPYLDRQQHKMILYLKIGNQNQNALLQQQSLMENQKLTKSDLFKIIILVLKPKGATDEPRLDDLPRGNTAMSLIPEVR
jgi:hypothetical protein